MANQTMALGDLDIGGEIGQFLEQNAGPRQHLLDLVGGVGDGRAEVSIVSSLAVGRLVIVADPGEAVQGAGARLGVMALGIAALADLGRRCDIDLAEQRCRRCGARPRGLPPTAKPPRRWRYGRCGPDGSRPPRAGGCFRRGPAAEKPRSPFRPARSVSPSSSTGEPPLPNSRRSSARASVDLPEPGSPVSQTTAPLWR